MHKDVAVSALEIMTAGDLEDFDRVVHPRAVNRESVTEPPACRQPGAAGFHATALWLREAYADLRWELHDVVQEGDVVAIRCTMSGRQVGTFVVYDERGEVADAFPSTGGTFTVTQSHWFRMEDGQVIEHWANRDDLGNASQLGWVPPRPVYLVRMALARRRARRALRREPPSRGRVSRGRRRA